MNIKTRVKEKIRHILMHLFYFSKRNTQPSVYFSSFSCTQYSDSPRAISEKLHEMAPDINIVWSAPDNLRKVIPDYVRIVQPHSIDALKAQSNATAWVFNGVLPYGTYKGKKTFYVQTWHGDRAFKQIGRDAYKSMGKNKYSGYSDYIEPRICDLFTVASSFGKKMIQSAFEYNGEFLDVGIPRNDILVNLDQNTDRAENVRRELGISEKQKVLLFAPTFRDHSKDKQGTFVNLSEVLDTLELNGDKWICLVRSHALSSGIDLGKTTDQRLIDATRYFDMADLLLIADCLVTDYSSSAQDFVLTKRPVVLAQYDIEEYTHQSRALYYDPMETGFLIAHNQKEILKIFAKLDEYDHAEISKKIIDYYGMHEYGHSTEEVCKRIISWCRK